MPHQPTSPSHRQYVAFVSKDTARPATRVTIFADDLEAARAELEALYGCGNIFGLHNPEDAAKSRGSAC